MNNFDILDPIVLGRRIAEMRKACGKTQEESARHLGMSRPTYIGIEKGTRKPSRGEVLKLAQFFGRNVNEVVRPDSPQIAFEPHLRATLSGTDGDSVEIVDAIAELHRFAVDYCELEQIVGAKPFSNYPAEVKVPGSRIGEFADDVAQRERSRLHLGDGPVLKLRDVLESCVGVRVFCVPTASKIAGMYAFVAELGYCVLLNAKHPRARLRWTLAHEYAHFLADRHKPGIDYTRHAGRVPTSERFADLFAMSFLMPATGLRRRYFDVTNSRGDFQVADLCRLANSYDVSVQAMTLRLESLSLVRRGTWDLLAEQNFKPESARKSLDLDSDNEESLAPYPTRYLSLAVLAHEAGKLSEGRLAKFLRTDRVSARKIARNYGRRSDDVLGDGTQSVISVPLEKSLLTAQ